MAWQCDRCRHFTANGQKHECINDEVEQLREENQSLQTRVARLREALEFYAQMNPMDFKKDFIFYHNYNPLITDAICGATAREALRADEALNEPPK